MKITVVTKASDARTPRMECPIWIDDVTIETQKK